MTTETLDDAPFLDIKDPAFSMRSPEVADARERSWYARTPYGIAVLRYEEVARLIRDPRLRQGSYAWPAHNGASGSWADWWLRIMLNREGADHQRLRKLANPAFSPKLVKVLRPEFRKLANELIDGFAAEGECEFVRAFAEPYATRVICLLLGTDQGDWEHLVDLAVQMGMALGTTYREDQDQINAATDEMFAYAQRIVDDLRARGLDDGFVSSLIRANQDNPDLLSEQEMVDTIVLSVFGGIDTTRNQIGLAMDTFIRHPDQWALLGDTPDLARLAVEEVMRVRPTVTWVTREALEDMEYQGLTIAKGTTVHMFSQSACSDPRAFDNPAFDITVADRKNHFGFGLGAHHCIGHFIARGDMTEALALLAQRVRNPRYAGEPTFLRDSGNTGPLTMPVAFDPET
ncbi:cytochrome P450 [Stappia sp.]|uniref:cytochrome P450 n=1 Tax=Stappia sp. TaxID=1870903 RepID=UPI0032D9AD73